MPDIDLSKLVYRRCETLEEWEACVQLQEPIWELPMADQRHEARDPKGSVVPDVVPRHVYAAVMNAGGQCLGTFHPDGRLIAFSLAFVGRARHSEQDESNQVYLHSHMVGVLKQYRDYGIGTRLKWAQRDQGIADGFDCMKWTFDPFQTRNALVNIGKLGGVVRKFLPNFYGITSSRLHNSMPTDRLLVEWFWKSPVIQSLKEGRRRKPLSDGFELEVRPEYATIQSERELVIGEFKNRIRDGWIVVDVTKIEDPKTAKPVGVTYILSRTVGKEYGLQ